MIIGFLDMIQRMERRLKQLFKREKPAYLRFSKHAYERMHCREYDR